jgi:hypothetical protein
MSRCGRPFSLKLAPGEREVNFAAAWVGSRSFENALSQVKQKTAFTKQMSTVPRRYPTSSSSITRPQKSSLLAVLVTIEETDTA